MHCCSSGAVWAGDSDFCAHSVSSYCVEEAKSLHRKGSLVLPIANLVPSMSPR